MPYISGRYCTSRAWHRLISSVLTALTMMVGTRGDAAQLAPASADVTTPIVLFDGSGLDAWTVDTRAKRQPAVAGEVLTLEREAGWLRTRRTAFGTFRLRFSVRATERKTRALVAFLGTSQNGVENAYAVPLLSGDKPDMTKSPTARLSIMLPDAATIAAARSDQEWQDYEIIRAPDRIYVRLNGKFILNLDGPVTIDGWLGFFVQSGQLQLRAIEVEAAPASAPSPFYRPGIGVVLPQLLREVKPNYTSAALQRKIQGSVLIECVVDVDGTVKRPLVVRFLDPTFGLDDEALRAASQWRFRPGTRDGVPVPVLVTIQLSFTLRD